MKIFSCCCNQNLYNHIYCIYAEYTFKFLFVSPSWELKLMVNKRNEIVECTMVISS